MMVASGVLAVAIASAFEDSWRLSHRLLVVAAVHAWVVGVEVFVYVAVVVDDFWQ
jgi:hypothetical protein